MKLRIEKAIYGGAGLARDEGKAIFVPFALPGEVIEAGIAHDHGSYADAELECVMEASPQRVHALCPYFGECGGCHYQQAEYSLQIEMKLGILRETLERARLKDIPEITALTGEPFAYRNRVRLHIDRATSKFCYKRRGSHENLAVDRCPIAAPVIENALRALQGEASEWRLRESFSEIEFFTNAAQDSLLLTLWSAGNARTAAKELATLWPRLQALVPEIAGVSLFSVEEGRRQSELLEHFGETSLNYTVGERSYRVGAGSFFQVNRFLIEPLVELVTGNSRGGVAWDLYAGVGLFSAALADRFEQVVAVEAAPSSVRDLRHNLQGKQHRVAASSTLDFLRRTSKAQSPDLVVVDPPRAGLGKDVAKLLAGARPAHVTYVSCGPATLSRDLKLLLDSGYHLREMRMVDLFPQTFHLESVAMLSL